MGKLTSVSIRYKFADDWHIFQSDDIHGLYVASKDAKVAYSDVQVSIEKLIFLNDGIKCSAHPELSYEEFVAHAKSGKWADDETRAPFMSNKRYYVTQARA